ncbi:substrate-binding domain-containing protein [Nocardia sp. R7R-8]|uniref:substrate-binding domain-containing protein n=1 Tax=Nocardia sp. R7R-8 TaxID=3459304 RepID=UPI00403E1C4A
MRKSVFFLALITTLVAGCATDQPADHAAMAESSPEANFAAFQLAPRIKSKIAAHETLNIYVSAPNTALAFARPQRKGAAKAAAALGVDVVFTGPSGGDAGDQINQLQTLIGQGLVDGIALSSASSNALKPVISQAYNAGVPLVSYSTDNPGSQELAFVGTDVADGGRLEGTELTKLLAGKTGTIVTTSVAPEAAWSGVRYDALKSALGPGLQVLTPVNTGQEPAQMFTAVQNAMAAHPDAVAIASLDCCSFTAAAKWVDQFAAGHKPLVVGFDAVQQTLDYVKKGVVSFAISQQPATLVYEAVELLVKYLVDGTPLHTQILPLVLVTKANADSITPEG